MGTRGVPKNSDFPLRVRSKTDLSTNVSGSLTGMTLAEDA